MRPETSCQVLVAGSEIEGGPNCIVIDDRNEISLNASVEIVCHEEDALESADHVSKTSSARPTGTR